MVLVIIIAAIIFFTILHYVIRNAVKEGTDQSKTARVIQQVHKREWMKVEREEPEKNKSSLDRVLEGEEDK
ncbi:hypothetical protein [Halobacillus litoralis]|uniref:Uncharacterized protein n=1 Tax=Halobacillus litoralis TaxID=45668 RepID=A0A410MIB4_9BACI|nr:hypothetical protein [Halobacillus litoralis]QAS54474.1 hypothetical protein HLI_20760 [Halobacillus litoralis]